jgi:hypothetical protein
LDEDLSQINVRKFGDSEDIFYPSVSLLFGAPFVYEKIQKYGNGITSTTYQQFLLGEFWEKTFADVDYEEVSVDINDYFVGYDILYDDSQRVSYNSTIHDSSRWRVPYSNGNISTGKLFTIDIPFEDGENLRKLDIKLRTKIFKDQVRPPKISTNNGFEGFGVTFHYPNQYTSAKHVDMWTWPDRDENASKSYRMEFELKNIEILQKRNKWRTPCIPGHPNIDRIWFKNYFQTMLCKPPYVYNISSVPPCSTKKDMKIVSEDFHDYRLLGNGLALPPCRTLEKIEFNYHEKDVKEEDNNDPYITISITFLDKTFRQLLNVRAFDAISLFGNIGGYVGIFVGYALLHVPDAIQNLVDMLQTKNKNVFDLGHNGKENDAEDRKDNRIAKLEEQMEQVQTILLN